MGKSRNSSYYKDYDYEERDRRIRRKDKHRDRQAKQKQRNKRYEVADDDGPFYEDESYQ